MTDGYWNRQQTLLSQSGMLKRPHSDYGSFPLSLSLSRFPARSLCFVQFALFLYSCLCKFVNFDFFFIDSLLLVLAIWLGVKRRHFACAFSLLRAAFRVVLLSFKGAWVSGFLLRFVGCLLNGCVRIVVFSWSINFYSVEFYKVLLM